MFDRYEDPSIDPECRLSVFYTNRRSCIPTVSLFTFLGGDGGADASEVAVSPAEDRCAATGRKHPFDPEGVADMIDGLAALPRHYQRSGVGNKN
jgi:hypothetical protein